MGKWGYYWVFKLNRVLFFGVTGVTTTNYNCGRLIMKGFPQLPIIITLG